MIDLQNIKCPECKAGDGALHLSSSRELEVSQIKCLDCGFLFQKDCCEEDLVDGFFMQYKELSAVQPNE